MFFYYNNILVMSKTINHGEYYIKNRKNQENGLKDKKNLEHETVLEGFNIINRKYQKKNPEKFLIPDGMDPGQEVMCEVDKVRFVKLSQTTNFLTIQEIEVYNEKGENVALTGGNNVDNKYELTRGLCRTNYGSAGYPSSVYQGKITVSECENACNNSIGLSKGEYCTAYEIAGEEKTKGENPTCWTYRDPSVTGNGSRNEMCRVRERMQGTPIATMSSQYENTDPYMAINGIKDDNQKWPNSACTATRRGGWWEVDLGQEVNVKRIVVYNRPDGRQERLNGTILSLIDRNHNTVYKKTLNSERKQIINVKLQKQNCGGPVIEKNMDDYDELKNIQLEFNRELQEYNQAIKDLVENEKSGRVNYVRWRYIDYINNSYKKLNSIINTMYDKIMELTQEDIILNNKLLSEYNILKNRLNTYEKVYKEIKFNKNMMKETRAMNEDSNLQMLSYNQKYILWSIVALGVTAGAVKLMKH